MDANGGVPLDETAPRYASLISLAQEIATTPYSPERVNLAVENVEKQGGKGLVVEAISTAAMFMAITKVVDSTRKKAGKAFGDAYSG